MTAGRPGRGRDRLAGPASSGCPTGQQPLPCPRLALLRRSARILDAHPGKEAPMTRLATPAPRNLAGVPDLSVVIASVNGWDVLEPTLRALDAQPERPYMEVIVVETVGDA